MKSDDIREGRIYIKKGGGLARQVVMIDGITAHYRSYRLSDGKNDGASLCQIHSLADWAEREAIPAEISKLDVDGAVQAEQDKRNNFVAAGLKLASDHELLAEVRRRGLNSDY